MEVRYNLNEETGLPHIYDPGINEQEVEDVLFGPGGDAPARRNARMKVGQTGQGRYIQVIYSPDEDGEGVFVITAYELDERAKKAFRRKRRQGR